MWYHCIIDFWYDVITYSATFMRFSSSVKGLISSLDSAKFCMQYHHWSQLWHTTSIWALTTYYDRSPHCSTIKTRIIINYMLCSDNNHNNMNKYTAYHVLGACGMGLYTLTRWVIDQDVQISSHLAILGRAESLVAARIEIIFIYCNEPMALVLTRRSTATWPAGRHRLWMEYQ